MVINREQWVHWNYPAKTEKSRDAFHRKLLRCFGWKDDYDGYFGEKNLNQKRNAVTVKAQTVGWWSFLLHGRKDE